MNKAFQVIDGDLSDGLHTFSDLYEHRHLLFINLCLMAPCFSAWRNDPDSDNFFLYLETRNGQVSYRIPNEFKPMVLHKIKFDPHYKWDGHKSEDVLNRLKGK